MARKIISGSWSSQQSNLYKGRTDEEDAYQVFDEMLTSEFDNWRPPNRILEVTVHKACYPITESLLCQVFGPFDVVEEVYLRKGLDKVEARVAFQSKQEASDAFGALHGWCVYNGCCRMEIKWAFSQESDVFVVTSNGCRTVSSSSSLLPSASVAMSTLDTVSFELVDATGNGVHTEATVVNVAMLCNTDDTIVQHVVISEIVDRHVVDELQAEVSNNEKMAIPDPDLGVVASSISDIVPSDVNVCVATNCLTKCLSYAKGVPEFMVLQGASPTSTLSSQLLIGNPLNPSIDFLAFLEHVTLDALRAFGKRQHSPTTAPGENLMHGMFRIAKFQVKEIAMVMWPLPVNFLKWEVWPPPMQVQFIGGSAEIQLTPWPSFEMEDWVSVLCFGLLRKPPWPLTVRRGCKRVVAVMVEIQEYMLIISGRKEYEPWDPETMVHSSTCLLLMYDCDLFLHKANSSFFLRGLCEILNLWELLVRNDLIKAQFQWCSTMCSEFSMVDSKQCTSKCSAVQREVPCFLYWTYRAARFFSEATNSAVLLLYHTIMFPPEKLDGFLSSRNEVQSFCDADGLGFTFPLSSEGSGSVNTMYRLACKLLRLSHQNLSIQSMLISIEENRSSEDIILSFCLQLLRILWDPRAWEHMLFFSNFQALKTPWDPVVVSSCLMEMMAQGFSSFVYSLPASVLYSSFSITKIWFSSGFHHLHLEHYTFQAMDGSWY